MAKVNKVIQSFNAGELSALMDSRIDQAKYVAGCRTLENFFPLIYGGAQRRPGTEFIAAQKSNSAKGRVVAFEHSVDDTYILLFENQVIRFFKDGAQLTTDTGTEDLSGLDNIVAHWKLNDNIATQVVIDADGATHNGDIEGSVVNTEDIHKPGKVGTGCFNIGGANRFDVTSHPDFNFFTGANDDPFSMAVWVRFVSTGILQGIIGRDGEWAFYVDASDKLTLQLVDNGNGKLAEAVADVAMTEDWHFVVCTYDGAGGGSAADGIILYVDGVAIAITATTESGYVSMENNAGNIDIGRAQDDAVGDFLRWADKIDNVAVFSDVLTATEATSDLFTADAAFEVETPYLTADLPTLKFEQSADVMFITHPDYEPRKLLRTGDTDWELQVVGLKTGPFRDQNTDTAKTIVASATTGSVTLTAVGHAPFALGTTAGHSPSGALTTSKSQTGALFKLVQAVSGTSQSIGETLNSTTADAVTTVLAVPKGVTWDWTTNGTWGTGGPSTLVLERSYDAFTTKETVATVTGLANKNIITSGTEDFADATYRTRVLDGSGTGNVSIQFSIRDTSHIGIVEITSVASSTVATGTVRTTLASTDKTHRFSEGSFSNRRSWPIDVTISAEERLSFAGNVSEPLTTWGSVIGDFTDFKLGSNDDDAIQFTLIGTGQQNRVRWMLSKDTLVIGTVGGEHLLGASKDEEALTPTNVKAKLRTTYGSEDIASILVNQAVLFVQRGGKKIREFLFSFEDDAHKADDLTVFSNTITGGGIVAMAYQRTPDPTLWCIRTDGEIAIMTYEREQNVFSWSRIVTRSGDEFESIVVIYGGARNEDEVWVTVKRSVNSGTVRYVERFFQRAMPSAIADMKYLDSFLTDTGGDTTVEVAHLIGETVQVLGDGLVQATKTVSGGGTITAAATATKYQVGLGYTSTLKPMKLDLADLGLATTKRINRAIVNVFETIGGEVGPDTSNLESIPTGTATLFTGSKEISIPGGYSREADIIIRQTDPLPMTALSLTLDVGASND